MKFSSNSVVPIYTHAVPSTFIPPPASTLIQIKGPNQTRNQHKRLSKTKRRGLLTFVGGLSFFVLIGVCVAVPLIMALNSSSVQTSTTTIGTTTIAITTNSTITTASNTSSTTSTTSTTTSTTSTTTSSTSTSTTTTLGFLQWNTTGVTIAGQLFINSATPLYLNLPIGICLDSSNTLYVADASNNRIQRFVSGNTTGTTMAGNKNGVGGSNSSLLNYTNDMALDANGNIYVVDSYNNRVQLWSVNASSGITIAGNGTAGYTNILLNQPRHIVFDSNPNIYYISDAANNRVLSYTLNSTVGTVVAGGNGAGNNRTQLNNPRGMYFESSTNSLLIANPGAHNIVRWVIGASNWTLVAGSINGLAGNGSSDLNAPWDVTLDFVGNMYVADRYNHRIQFFLPNQTNGTTIAGTTGILGTGVTTLDQPLSIALDSQLNLYVSDSFNNRIQKFFRYN